MQVSLAGVPTRTDDMLHFLVVGGGIAGLATAWSLQAAGHRVTVLEQNSPDTMSKCREAIRCTPTMIKILNDWGIGDKLAEISAHAKKMMFFDGETGEELGFIAIDGQVRESLPENFGSAQYGALFSLFRNLAKDAGVDMHFNTRVVSIHPRTATVTCEDGQLWSADVVVGADGTDSIVRPVVVGDNMSPPDRDNRFTINLVVPIDVARRDKDLAALLDNESWTVWLGDDCSITAAPTGPGPSPDYSMVMNITIDERDELEEFPLSLESLRIDSFEPRVQKLLKLAKQLNKVVFIHHEPFDTWVHESGRVVLVGEAAHPMLPSWSHNTCTCIEDAMTLSMLFSLPATKHHTSMLLNVYEELRQPRCASVQRYMRRKREIITIPRGEGQRRRDALLRDQRACLQEAELDDDFMYATYTGFLQVYGFDAREAVQDWWVTWGRSIFIRSPSSESEQEDESDDDSDQGPILFPVVVDADVEWEAKYPIISDPLMGEDECVFREVEAYRRRSLQI